MGRFVVLASFRQPFGCTPLARPDGGGRVPYPADRVTVWGEAHGPASVRSKLAAVRSSDRLDSGERLPLRISHWEGGYWSTLGDFLAFRRSTPSGCPVRYFYVLKQKYRTLHPGGNLQANVWYYKYLSIVNFFGCCGISFNLYFYFSKFYRLS